MWSVLTDLRSSPFLDRFDQWAAVSPPLPPTSLSQIIRAEIVCSYGDLISTTPPKQPDPPPRPPITAQQATHPQPVLLLRLPPTCRTITTHTTRRWLNSPWLTTISLTKRLLPRLDLQELVYQALGPVLVPVLVQVLGPEQEQQQTQRLKDIWDLMANGFIRLNPLRRPRRGRGRRSSGLKEGGSGRIRRCWSGILVSVVLRSILVFSPLVIKPDEPD
jgi:hypothetical protein